MLTTIYTYTIYTKTGRLSLKLLYFEAKKKNKKNIFVSAFHPTFAIGLTL